MEEGGPGRRKLRTWTREEEAQRGEGRKEEEKHREEEAQ